jgi:hypothetical protein
MGNSCNADDVATNLAERLHEEFALEGGVRPLGRADGVSGTDNNLSLLELFAHLP